MQRSHHLALFRPAVRHPVLVVDPAAPLATGVLQHLGLAHVGRALYPCLALMSVIVAPGGIVGFDWVWLGLALLADVISYSGRAYGNRDRTRKYTR